MLQEYRILVRPEQERNKAKPLVRRRTCLSKRSGSKLSDPFEATNPHTNQRYSQQNRAA